MDWTQVSALCAFCVVFGGAVSKLFQIGAKNQEIKQITDKLVEFSVVLNRVETKVDDMAQRVSKLEGIVEIYASWRGNQANMGD